MKKVTNSLISLIVLLVLLLSYSSCGDEEKKTPTLSFSTLSQDVGEGDEEIFIPYDIENGPTPATATISFDFAGTATLDEDFEFLGWTDEGLYLTLFDDIDVESDETIVVTMTDSEGVNVSSSPHTVTIEDDDVDTGTSLKIDLKWDDGTTTPTANVDMDLWLWMDDDGDLVFDEVDKSESFTEFESVILPFDNPNAEYGLTFLYYDGTSNNVDFTVKFVTTDGTIDGTLHQRTFEATYTLDNLSLGPQFIEQFFDKTGTNYHNFSAIDVPSSGSRTKSFILPSIKSKQNAETKRVTVQKSNIR